MIGRRTFFHGSASLGFFTLSGCGEPLPAPPMDMADILHRPIVDVHAHVFNAKDLPGFPFIAQVYVEPVLGAFSFVPHLLLMAVAHHVENKAPDDTEERRALQGQRKSQPTTEELVTAALLTLEEGSLPVRATNPPSPSQRAPSPAAAAAPLAIDNDMPETPGPDRQRAAFAALVGRTAIVPPAPAAAPAAAPSPALAAPADRTARARLVAARLLAPASPRTFPAPAAAPPPGMPTEYEPPGQLRQLLHWFQEFSQYRAQRIDAWEQVVGGSGNRFCMPALVDFGFSLRHVDETDVPLARQVEVMGELSRNQKRGRLVHGYVPFNPIRYALRGATALDLVKEAIEKHGFVGVKLYPPMGFRVFDNAGARPDLSDLLRYLGAPFTDNRAAFARRVDDGLRLLFEYCAIKDVAIMAHTNPSNLAYHTYIDRPNPAHWREVLRQWPGLRVNFGHFGGAFEKSEDEGRADYAWAREIIRLFRDHPNTYGDFADYELVLDADDDDLKDKADLTAFLRGLDPAQKALMNKRLIFGTDWSMLGRVPNHHRYASKMLQYMADTLGGSIDDYAANNALRFVGLDDDNSQATARLVEFHRTGSVNGPTLDAFRKLVRRS